MVRDGGNSEGSRQKLESAFAYSLRQAKDDVFVGKNLTQSFFSRFVFRL